MNSNNPGMNPENSAAGSSSGPPAKVLFIEQDPVSLQLISRLLAKDGFSFLVVDSWKDVEKEVRSYLPNIVVIGQVETDLNIQCQVDSIKNESGSKPPRILVIERAGESVPPGTIMLGRPLNWGEVKRHLDNTFDGGTRRTLLLINPDPLFNSVLSEQLARIGWVVKTAPHIQAAFHYLNGHSPDIIFMETRWGVREIKKISEAAGSVSLFLLATCKFSPDEEEQLSGHSSVIFKPGHFSLRELQETLQKIGTR